MQEKRFCPGDLVISTDCIIVLRYSAKPLKETKNPCSEIPLWNMSTVLKGVFLIVIAADYSKYTDIKNGETVWIEVYSPSENEYLRVRNDLVAFVESTSKIK